MSRTLLLSEKIIFFKIQLREIQIDTYVCSFLQITANYLIRCFYKVLIINNNASILIENCNNYYLFKVLNTVNFYVYEI